MKLFGRRKQEPDTQDPSTLPERPAFSSTPDDAALRAFRMVVADVFFLTGRGVVATGTVEAGVVDVGSQVIVERDGQQVRTVTVSAIEAGENIGLLFGDLTKKEIASGDVLRAGNLPSVRTAGTADHHLPGAATG